MKTKSPWPGTFIIIMILVIAVKYLRIEPTPSDQLFDISLGNVSWSKNLTVSFVCCKVPDLYLTPNNNVGNERLKVSLQLLILF